MSKIVLLPGSKWQMQLAEKIKEMGHYLYVISPEEKPPCASIADVFFRSDIFAIDEIENYLGKVKVDAILSDECDIAMPVVAELGDRLNINTLSKEAALLYTDKFMMREFCNKHAFKTPEYRLCKTVEEAMEFFLELGKTIIIKPLDSNASHGVFTIESENELIEHFDETMFFSRVEKAILAERYINGTEFTIDGIKTPNAHYTLAISEKKHFKHNMNIANELYFTHSNPAFDYEKLRQTNDAFVMKSSLSYGFTHAEYKCENGEFYLIEIGARGGGNMISSVITQFMSGYDTYKYLVECSLGQSFNKDFTIPIEYLNRASVLKFFNTPYGGGIVKRIEGLDYLENEKRIAKYQLNFQIGDLIEDAKNDSARIGFFIACAESVDELEQIISNVESKFKVIVE